MKVDIDYIPHNIAIYQKVGDDFIIKAINQTAEQTENVNRENLIGEKLTDIFKSVKEVGLIEVLDRVLATGKDETFDLHIYSDDRQKGWRFNEVIIIDKAHVMAVYQDVSNDLKKNQDLINLGKMIDSSDNEYYIFSSNDLRFTYFNQSAEKNIGYTFEEISEMTPVDIKPDYTFDQFIHVLHDLKLEKTSQVVFETRHKRKDGSFYDVEARVQLMTVGDERQYVATVLDVTNRNSLESKLDSLGLIVDNSMNEVYIFDRKNLKFNYANKSAQKNIGYPLSELKNSHPLISNPILLTNPS